MAVILIESFDLYKANSGGAANLTDGSSLLSSGWECYYPHDSSLIVGRYGGLALRKPSIGGREDWYRPFSPGLTTFTVGFDLRVKPLGVPITAIRENGSTDHLWIEATTSGAIQVRRGDGGTILATSDNNVLEIDTWSYIEIGAVISSTVGQLYVWVEGIQVIGLTGINTRNGGTSGVYNTIDIIEGGTKDFDNLYIKDTLGTWGPLKIETLYILSDDASSGFTPLAGVNLYEMVDETITDLDTTYMVASNVNDQATFNLTDLSSTEGTVQAVKVTTNARKADGTAGRAIRHLIKNDSTTASTPNDLLLNAAYTFTGTIFDLDPSGAAWTTASVNSLRVGVKVSV